MEKSELQEILKSITEIKNNRDYWFVRTLGGSYYETFVENSYIAIGYDAINLSSIQQAYSNNTSRQTLSTIIKNKYSNEKRPNYIGNQLIDFSYNIKKGDIVIIPSNSSSAISIGEVVETPIYEIENKISANDCPFLKRKKIKWLKKNISFEQIDNNLIKLKYTRRTVTKIDDELATFIDRTTLPIYIKNDNAHLSLNVTKKDHLPAYTLFSTWAELLNLTEEFGNEENLEINKNDIDLRINVQSPGTIEFITYSVVGLVTLSLIVVALIGADFQSNSRPFRFNMKSDGLIKKVSDFLDKRKDRIIKENLTEKIKSMELNPDEIVNILKQLNPNGNNDTEV